MDRFWLQRQAMVQNQIVARGVKDRCVIEAMLKVPRHMFVPEEFQDESYNDHPLPIGENQTISQPYMVAIMSEALELTGEEKVLEVGTGSGYQTAILAECAKEVYTVERIESLSRRAQKILETLGYNNVHFYVGDGSKGLPDKAPFDAILVTAGAKHIPQALVDQLACGGRLVIPVDEKGAFGIQTLLKITKGKDGKLTTESLGGCRFVPLVGDY